MASLRFVLFSVFVPLLARADGATIGYAQATGYFKKDSRPTRYQPLNLLDARDATAWCTTSSDPLNDQLTFGFSDPVTLTELRISNGNNFSENDWSQFARGSRVLIKNGKEQRSLQLEDVRGLKTYALSPPLSGTRFSVEVLDVHPTDDDPDAPACLTDIVFVADGKHLNGQWLTTQLKYDKAVQYVMGTWFGGYEGTPDHFLSFNYDGTYRYSYEPYDQRRNTPRVIRGRFDVVGTRLRFEVEGKKYTVGYGRDGGKLTFDGELPEGLKGPWRAQP